MADITGSFVAFLATEGFEDSELTSPWKAVTDAGAEAKLVAPKASAITGAKGHEQKVDALVEADVVDGRTMTSYPSLRTDLVNAGANWVDEEVVVDQGFVSSRTPDDLPAFNQKLVEEIGEGPHPGQHA